jgi:RES domain-containing protein
MTPPRLLAHTHSPVLRVVRRGWQDPLDASYSQRVSDNRWNTSRFPALYCCCSLPVAQAVARTRLARIGAEIDELSPEYLPALAEVAWVGDVVDVASEDGIRDAGFPPAYPEGAGVRETQAAAEVWHDQGREGVVCRSFSLWARGVRRWAGSHEPWGEVAIFVRNARTVPALVRRHDELSWLGGGVRP